MTDTGYEFTDENPELTMVIKADHVRGETDLVNYFREIESRTPDWVGMGGFKYALIDVFKWVQKDGDDITVELYRIPHYSATGEMTNCGWDIRLLWVPDWGQAGLCSNGDWFWTDASDPADALHQFTANDDDDAE